jgi:hypothetical protein
MRCRAIEAWLLCLAAAGASAAIAQPRWGAEAAAGVWSGNRESDGRSGVAVARGGLSVDWAPSPLLRLRADLWASAATEPLAGGQHTHAGAREALLSLRLPCEPALGKRVVAWGRTDVISPTDQLTPTDYRRLTPKDTEQRLGVWGLHLSCALGPGQLQLHTVDPRSFHRVPYTRQPGVTVLVTAVRYEVLGSGVDGALSAIDGIDLHPTLVLRGADAAGLRIGQAATRMQLLGADLAFGEGARVWRTEVAWVSYDNATPGLQAQRRPWASAVLQLEWSLGGTDTVSLQGFAKRLRGTVPPPTGAEQAALQQAQGLLANELDRTQHGWTLRWARRFAGERSELELLLVHSRPRDDGLLRLRWSHALTDSVRLVAGGERYFGPAASYLGNLRRNSLAFIEASHSW